MNTTTMRTMIAAAALVVAASSASAQTYKAEVPMAFQVGSKTLAAGSYDIHLIGGPAGPTLVIRNRDTRNSAVLVTNVRSDAPKTWREAGDPKIAFECLDSSCTLRKLWTGSDSFAYVFPAPKAPAGNLVAQRLEVVTLSMMKAD